MLHASLASHDLLLFDPAQHASPEDPPALIMYNGGYLGNVRVHSGGIENVHFGGGRAKLTTTPIMYIIRHHIMTTTPGGLWRTKRATQAKRAMASEASHGEQSEPSARRHITQTKNLPEDKLKSSQSRD